MCSCVVNFCQNYAGQDEIRLRAAYRATRQRVLDHDTVFDDGYSADQHAADTGGGAGAVDVRGVVGDSLGVENEDVRVATRADPAFRRHRGNRLLQNLRREQRAARDDLRQRTEPTLAVQRTNRSRIGAGAAWVAECLLRQWPLQRIGSGTAWPGQWHRVARDGGTVESHRAFEEF